MDCYACHRRLTNDDKCTHGRGKRLEIRGVKMCSGCYLTALQHGAHLTDSDVAWLLKLVPKELFLKGATHEAMDWNRCFCPRE